MTKKLLLLIAVGMIFLSGCALNSSILGQTDRPGSPTPMPTSTPINYKPIQTVGGIPKNLLKDTLKNELLYSGLKATDGYYILDTNSRSKIAKYSLSGQLLWEKTFLDTKDSGILTSDICLSPDGGFIYGLSQSSYWKNDKFIYTAPVVQKCDKDGNVLWKKKYEGYTDNAIQKVFCTKAGEVLTIGYVEKNKSTTSKQYSETDIYLSKLDQNGKLIAEKYYGGSSFDDTYVAKYIENIGIVSLIHTQSLDGTFMASTNDNPNRVIAVFNNNLDLSWYKTYPVFMSSTDFKVCGDYIYTLESIPIDFKRLYKLNVLDFKGNTIKNKDLGVYDKLDLIEQSSGGLWIQYSKSIALYDNIIEKQLEIPFDAGRVEKVIIYSDYYLIISGHITGNMPQPVFISSMWFSSELVYSAYDFQGKLIWRDAYDDTPEAFKKYDPKKDDIYNTP